LTHVSQLQSTKPYMKHKSNFYPFSYHIKYTNTTHGGSRCLTNIYSINTSATIHSFMKYIGIHLFPSGVEKNTELRI